MLKKKICEKEHKLTWVIIPFSFLVCLFSLYCPLLLLLRPMPSFTLWGANTKLFQPLDALRQVWWGLPAASLGLGPVTSIDCQGPFLGLSLRGWSIWGEGLGGLGRERIGAAVIGRQGTGVVEEDVRWRWGGSACLVLRFWTGVQKGGGLVFGGGWGVVLRHVYGGGEDGRGLQLRLGAAFVLDGIDEVCDVNELSVLVQESFQLQVIEL